MRVSLIFEVIASRSKFRRRSNEVVFCQHIRHLTNFSFLSSSPPEHLSDSWRPIYLAADNHLFLESVCEFKPLEGYKSSGYRSQDKFFHNNRSLTLTFCKTSTPNTLAEAVDLERKKRHSKFSRIHPIFERDISILYRNEFKQEDEDFMFKHIRKIAGEN